MRRYINLFVPHRTWLYILFSTDLICYLLIQKTSIYLESLENNSNKNGDDDDNNGDNNDTNKTVQLVKSTIQPTKRESRRAAHVLAEKTMWKKYNKNNFLAPDESRIPRDSDELMHERIKEQLNTLRVLCSWAKSAWKQWRPGPGRSAAKLILSESEKTKQFRWRRGLH